MGVVYLDLGVKQAAGSLHLNGSSMSTDSASPALTGGHWSIFPVIGLSAKRVKKKSTAV